MSYKIVPIDGAIVKEARETLLSPQYKSLDAIVSVANGYGPCRSCLQVFQQGVDRRLYFTYNSFDGLSPLPSPGPVFVHNEECAAFGDDGFPPDLLDLPILFEAFGEDSRLVSRERMDPATAEEQVGTAFEDLEVRYINLRNAEAGCFIARAERI